MQEMKEEIKKQTRYQNLASVFLLVIMSHGGRGYVAGVDGMPVSIHDDIITPLDGHHWPKMQGKPKIILLQACRGQREYS